MGLQTAGGGEVVANLRQVESQLLMLLFPLPTPLLAEGGWGEKEWGRLLVW